MILPSLSDLPDTPPNEIEKSLVHQQDGYNKSLETFRVQGIQEAEKERRVCCCCPLTKSLGKTDQLSRS
jgi:hypothetical protein